MTARQERDRRAVNRARAAINSCTDALAPMLRALPEGGMLGKGRAELLMCSSELVASLRELEEEDDQRTPVQTGSGTMPAVRVGEVVKEIFDKAKEPKR